MSVIKFSAPQVYKPRVLPGHLVYATAKVDAYVTKGAYKVTVWGLPPDDVTMVFTLKGESEREVAMEGIRRFVEIMKSKREERLKAN